MGVITPVPVGAQKDGGLINAPHLYLGTTDVLEDCDELVVYFFVAVGGGFQKRDTRAEDACIIELGACFDAKSLGLIAGSQDGTVLVDVRSYRHRLTAELGSVLLLNASKERVHVEEDYSGVFWGVETAVEEHGYTERERTNLSRYTKQKANESTIATQQQGLLRSGTWQFQPRGIL